MTNIALIISIITGTGFLAHGFNLSGLDFFARWIIALGVIWLIAQYNHWDWFSSAALIIAVCAAGLGLWLGLHAGWLIGGSIFSLAAWDLTELRRGIQNMPKDNVRGMELRRLARLSFLTLAGLTFAALLLLVRRQFTLDWGILLIAMFAVSLVQLIIGARVK